MVAADRLHDDPSLDIPNVVAATPKLNLLRVAMIYGANASGKSNLVAALTLFRLCILRSSSLDFRVAAEPFMPEAAFHDAPTVFEVVVQGEGVRWRYGFAVGKGEIVEEWLYASRSSRESLLFERDGDRIRRGASFPKGQHLTDSQGTLHRKSALFLTLCAEQGVPDCFEAAEAIAVKCRVLHGIQDEDAARYTAKCFAEDRHTGWMQRLYQTLDLGFEAVQLEQGVLETVRRVKNADGSETHDTNLLERYPSYPGFRRDQIWFVDKGRDGVSQLYSLAEFRGMRKSRNLEDDYLAGRFGALPVLPGYGGMVGAAR